MRNLILRFRKGEVSVPAVEFGLVCGLTSIVIVGTVTPIGQHVLNVFTQIHTAFTQIHTALSAF